MHSLPNCENLKTKTVINFGTAKFSLAYTYTQIKRESRDHNSHESKLQQTTAVSPVW